MYLVKSRAGPTGLGGPKSSDRCSYEKRHTGETEAATSHTTPGATGSRKKGGRILPLRLQGGWASRPQITSPLLPALSSSPEITPKTYIARQDTGHPVKAELHIHKGFPGGSDSKESAWVGKIPWRRERQPTPVFLPREFHGQRSPVGYHPWGRKELNSIE